MVPYVDLLGSIPGPMKWNANTGRHFAPASGIVPPSSSSHALPVGEQAC